MEEHSVQPAEGAFSRSERELLGLLDASIEPVPVSLLYRIGLALLAVAMVLLPLVYLGLIGAVGWLVVEHAVENTFILSGRGGAMGKGILYFGPIVVGATGIFFMIKPIFAPPPKRPVALTLSREEAPLLFAYVGRLSERVGAPAPAEIRLDDQVNASAGLKGPFGLFTGELVLTIGAPLVGAMDLRSLTGVLAHEFGHFAQGAAMRVQYVIRSVNFWFARVVYQRDAWDEGLQKAAEQGGHLAIVAVFWAARLFVWLSRKVLWVLMWVGNAISCFVARQMEYDADRYEARIAGSEAFSRTMVEMSLLMLASSQSDRLLEQGWSEKKVCDDFVGLHLAMRERVPAEAAQELEKAMLEEPTGLLDTHPSARDRIESVRREQQAGIVRSDARAGVLLPRMEHYGRELTRSIVRNNLGEEAEGLCFVPARELVAEHDAMTEGQKCFERMFQGVFPRGHLLLPADALPEDAGEASAEALATLRARMVELAAARGDARRVSEQLDDQQATAWRGERLARAIKLRPEQYGLPFKSPEEIAPFAQKVGGEAKEAAAQLEPVFSLARERLAATLRLAAAAVPPPELASLAGEGAEARKLYDALAALRPAFQRREELRRRLVSLDAMLGAFEGREKDTSFIGELLFDSQAVRDCAEAILEDCRKVPYPFAHASGEVPVATVLCEELPPRDYVAAVMGAGGAIYSGLGTLYARAMFRLVRVAEKTETALGLQPLPQPQPPAEGS